MNKLPRLGLLACLAVVTSVMVGITPVMAAVPEPAGDGMAQLGSCLASKGEGSVLLLIDQSGSLRETDPEKARVEASEYLVERLANYATRSGVKLDVRVAGFASDYLPIGGWTTLDDSTVASVDAQIRAAGDQIYNYDTDYWMAFEGARQDLVDHDGAAGACRAIALFTDGDYDVDPRMDANSKQQFGTEKPYAPGHQITSEEAAQAVTEIGKEDICRTTGLADQLRSSGIVLLGVGLAPGGAEWPYLRSVILGGGKNAQTHGVSECGALDSPAGTFAAAADIDSLYMAFDSISAPGETLTSETVEVCQGETCSEGEARFVLDQSLKTVHIMSSTSVPDLDVFLFRPGQTDPVGLTKPAGDDSELRPVEGVSYRWLTNQTLQIDLESIEGAPWDGIWRIGYVDKTASSGGEKVTVNISMSSPLVLEWMNLPETTLRADSVTEPAQLRILDRAGGTPIDPSTLAGSIVASVYLRDASGTQTELFSTNNPGSLANDVTTQIGDVALGQATITTRLEVATRSETMEDGTVVGPTVLIPGEVTESALVSAPLNFPAVGDSANFGLLDGTSAAETAVTVSGPGCVWLESGKSNLQATPAGAGEVVIGSTSDSEETCIKLQEGQTGQLPLTLKAQSSANGRVAGTVSVALASLDEPGDPKVAVVGFEADMRKPLNVGVAWVTFLIVFAVGVGVPLLALYLGKARSSVFSSGIIAWGTTRVRVPDDEGEPVAMQIDVSRMTSEVVRKGARSLMLGGYRFRTVMGWLPTSTPRAELASPMPSVSGMTPGERAGRAQVPLGLRGQWVAVLDQPDSPDTVTLLIMTRSNDPVEVERVLDGARRDLSSAVRSVSRYRKTGSVAQAPPIPEQPPAPTSVFGSEQGYEGSLHSPFGQSSPFDS